MAVAITRTEFDADGLRHAATRAKDADAARRMLALALVWTAAPGPKRLKLAAWIARPFAIGCIATTTKAWPGCRTARRQGRRHA